ncbi:hypothetical protein VTL71DRAFT_9796, partial [Oculimacula yallundae]
MAGGVYLISLFEQLRGLQNQFEEWLKTFINKIILWRAVRAINHISSTFQHDSVACKVVSLFQYNRVAPIGFAEVKGVVNAIIQTP